MQQFLVPQFIDVEDKIIGPITTRQFVIMLASLLLVFVFYRLFSFFVFLFVAVITVAIAAVFAFARVNGRPIHYFLLNFIQTSKKPRLRVWNKEAYVKNVQEVKSEIKEKQIKKKKKAPVSGSRLRDVSLIVNTGGVYTGGGFEGENSPPEQ